MPHHLSPEVRLHQPYRSRVAEALSVSSLLVSITSIPLTVCPQGTRVGLSDLAGLSPPTGVPERDYRINQSVNQS